jgi:RNA polymerase sigma factor (TIGR02999 family)
VFIVAASDHRPPRVVPGTEEDGMLQPSPDPIPPPRRALPPPRTGTRATGTPALTDLLLAWGAGDRTALDALVPLVYAELRRQARRALRDEAAGHTLQPTALVHEAFLRLVDQRRARWESRTQFLAVAAQAMRRVLVDHARARRAAKRGAGARRVTLVDADVPHAPVDAAVAADGVDVLALDVALTRLAALDPRKARLVELRYFAGLSIPEAAEALAVSPATVGREWAVARRWLRRELDG